MPSAEEAVYPRPADQAEAPGAGASSKSLRILVLKDRRPGEYRKAEGLASVIARETPSDVYSVDAFPKLYARNRVRLWALRRFRTDPGRALSLLYGFDRSIVGQPDVVIGAGRPTAAAGILVARLTGAKFIYCGHLRDYSPDDIDLMLVASPRYSGEPNAALTPIPCKVDPGRFRPPRELRTLEQLNGAEISLLVGGPHSNYVYSNLEWQRLGDIIVASGHEFGIRWRVANSRRTPDAVSDSLSSLEQRGEIREFLDFRSAKAGSVEALLDADAIVVTEDSLSMIAEGLAAMRPVVALRPAGGRRHGYVEELVTMAQGGSLAILPLRSLTPRGFVETLLSLEPPRHDPRDLIAAAVMPVIESAAKGPDEGS